MIAFTGTRLAQRSDAGRLEIGASRLAPNAGFLLDAPQVARFVSPWRNTAKLRGPTRPRGSRRNMRRSWRLARIEKMTEDQQLLFNRIANQCPDAINLRSTALAFRAALTADSSASLRLWIEAAKRSPFGPLVRFAHGLQKDISAVTAAVETSWSTGQVEGQINRLKAIQRQMYGRAGFQLLRARILPYTPAFGPALPHETHQKCKVKPALPAAGRVALPQRCVGRVDVGIDVHCRGRAGAGRVDAVEQVRRSRIDDDAGSMGNPAARGAAYPDADRGIDRFDRHRFAVDEELRARRRQ